VTDARESSEIYVGKHVIRFEQPDAYSVALIGNVSGSDMVQYNAEIARYAEGKRWLLVVADMTRTTSFSPQARRETVHIPLAIRGVAMFGVSARLRIPLTILYKAFSLVRRKISTPMAFVETETEARAWVAERRRELERGGA